MGNSETGEFKNKNQPNWYSDELEKSHKKVATLDFSSERKAMSTLIQKDGEKSNWVLLKGAPERILRKCDGFMTADDSAVKFKNDGEKEKII